MTRTSQVTQILPPAIAAPVQPDRDTASGLQTSSVYVVFTTIEDTLSAIRVAGGFAKALEVPVTILHFRTVSYALPIDGPAGISPIETAEFAQSLEREGLDVRVKVYLCREALAAVPLALTSPSLVVIGGRQAWWGYRASQSTRWRRALEARGHLVIFAANTETKTAGVSGFSRTSGVFHA
jgi:hypothetical protein